VNRYWTRFRYFPALVFLALLICLSSAKAHPNTPQDPAALMDEAWEAWEKGEIEQAGELARKLIRTKSVASSGYHLLFLKDFLEGNYEEALQIYKEIDSDYPKYGELDETVINTYIYLGRYLEAEKFARSRNMEEHTIARLRQLNEHLLKVKLDTLSIIPFAEGPLHEYFPDFEVELNGEKTVAHIDTGGAFLHMAPERAAEFGIELVPFGKGRQADTKTDLYHGIAESFLLGEAILENVPVVALASLEGQKFVIFGTNVLQQFFSTLDYPNKRLILSPRGYVELQEEHLAILSPDRVEISFYLAQDHKMFARGGLGEHKNLNFFIDSGLVYVKSDDRGTLRQAAFTTHPSMYEQWGYDPEDVKSKWFKSHHPLSLGPLEQEGHYFTTSELDFGPYEGVKIHGLLSHAFLKKYTWTIDFAKRRYIFSSQPKE
jgi:hypothetical protein